MGHQRVEILATGRVGGKELGAAATIRQPLHAIISPITVAANDDRMGPGPGQGFAKRASEHARSSNHDRGPSLQSVKSLEIGIRRHDFPGPKRWRISVRGALAILIENDHPAKR